jgi:hypothetical protein
MGSADGGYTLAIAARAAAEAAERPDPVTVTAHYLAPARAGPVTVEARAIRRGNRFATVAATLASAERPLLALLGTFAELGGYDGPERVEGAPPTLPPPEECVLVVPTEMFPPPFMGRVELRVDSADDVFGGVAGPPGSAGAFASPRPRWWTRSACWWRWMPSRRRCCAPACLSAGYRPRADGLRACPPQLGLAALCLHHSVHHRRLLGGGRRGVARYREAGGAVPPAGAAPQGVRACPAGEPAQHHASGRNGERRPGGDRGSRCTAGRSRRGRA